MLPLVKGNSAAGGGILILTWPIQQPGISGPEVLKSPIVQVFPDAGHQFVLEMQVVKNR